jgi:DNA polymerase III delta prime subunit
MKTDGISGHMLQFEHLERMLRSGSIPGTLLFSGLPGIGKRKVALRLLKALFCEGDDRPCLQCRDCRLIAGGSHPDVIEISPGEKGSIPVGSPDEPGTVRWLISRLSKKSVSGRYGVTINGIENISSAGQNALLKTIEEPQEGAVIILITSNKMLILPTILSRAAEISFRELSPAQIMDILKRDGVTSPDIELIAEISGGSVEMASLLASEGGMEELSGIVSSIVEYARNRGMLRLDIDAFQKRAGAGNMVFLLVSSFRKILLQNLRGGEVPGPFSGHSSLDREILVKIIRILLSMKRGLAVNINASVMLKAMLYSMDDMNDEGLPSLDDFSPAGG